MHEDLCPCPRARKTLSRCRWATPSTLFAYFTRDAGLWEFSSLIVLVLCFVGSFLGYGIWYCLLALHSRKPPYYNVFQPIVEIFFWVDNLDLPTFKSHHIGVQASKIQIVILGRHWNLLRSVDENSCVQLGQSALRNTVCLIHDATEADRIYTLSVIHLNTCGTVGSNQALEQIRCRTRYLLPSTYEFYSNKGDHDTNSWYLLLPVILNGMRMHLRLFGSKSNFLGALCRKVIFVCDHRVAAILSKYRIS